jgi:hypothetical protein
LSSQRQAAFKNFGFSSVKRNVKKKGISGEYDIIAVGDDRILVVEVKKKMEEHLINAFPDKKLPRFRQIFPKYRDFQIIGGKEFCVKLNIYFCLILSAKGLGIRSIISTSNAPDVQNVRPVMQ